MALTLQKKLELAGALSKVQPQLQRLHLLPEPKKSHRKRNILLGRLGCRRRGQSLRPACSAAEAARTTGYPSSRETSTPVSRTWTCFPANLTRLPSKRS